MIIKLSIKINKWNVCVKQLILYNPPYNPIYLLILLKDKSLKIINIEIKIIDITNLEYKIDLSFLIDTAFESIKKIKQ